MRVFLSLFCLFLAFTAAPAADTQIAAPNGTAIRVATLRLDEAIRNAKFFTSRIDSINQEQGEAKKSLQEMEEQLKQLQNQLGVLARTNERFPKVQEEAEVIKLKMKMFEERVTGNIDRRFTAVVKDSYAIVRQLLKDYSKSHNIQLVHILPSGELKARTASDVQMELLMQSVLYSDDSLDITGDFIAFLNARYAAEKPVETTVPMAPLAPLAPVKPTETPAKPAQGK